MKLIITVGGVGREVNVKSVADQNALALLFPDADIEVSEEGVLREKKSEVAPTEQPRAVPAAKPNEEKGNGKCTHCQESIPAHAKYCQHCGGAQLDEI